MDKRLVQSRITMVLIVASCAVAPCFGIPGAHAGSTANKDDRLADDLRQTRQELDKAREAVASLKALYADKEILSRDLKMKLDKLQDNFRRSQESIAGLTKEKELLAAAQTKLLLQVKQLETEKYILRQQNQLLSTCTKENEAKSKELALLRTSSAQEKKDLMGKNQQYQQKVDELSKQHEALTERKSDLEVKYATTSQQIANYKNDEIGCLGQKEALAVQMRDLQKETDRLRKELTVASGRAEELDEATAKLKKQQGLEEELTGLRRNFAVVQNDLKQQQQENRKLTELAAKYDKQANLQQELSELRKKLSDAQKEKAALELETAQCTKQEDAKRQLEDLRSALVKSEQQRAELQQVCGKAKKQEQDLEAKFVELSKKLAGLQEENKKMQQASLSGVYVKTVKDEIEHLRSELEQGKLAKKKVEQGYDRSQQQLTSATEELKVLRASFAKLESENKKLQEVSSKTKGRDAVLQEAALLRQEIDELKSENKRLKNRPEKCPVCPHIEKTQTTGVKELESLRKNFNRLEDERDSLKSEVTRLRREQQTLTEQFASPKKENPPAKPVSPAAVESGSSDTVAKLKEELKTTQDLSYQLVKEKAEAQKREKELSERFTEVQSQKSALEQEKTQVIKKNTDLQNEYARLSEQIARLTVQYADLEKQRQAFSGKSNECRQEVVFFQDKLNKSEQLVSSLQLEVENLKKENKDLNVQAVNLKIQNEQDLALTRAQLEQLNALKEGEYVQLASRFQEYKNQKEFEAKSLNDQVALLKKELQNAQELSFQMVQEKSSLQGQQKTATERLRDLDNQKVLLEQQRQELEKQNAFLKNQYVSISQDIARVKEEAVRLEKTKIPLEFGQCTAELDTLKKQLAQKDQEYLKKVKGYEEKYKGYGDTDKDKRALFEDLAKVRNNYEELQKRYEVSEKIRKDLESVKERYGRLPEENANLHYNLGTLYAQNKDYQKAIPELKKVIELKPNDAEAYYNLGVIYGEYLNDRKNGIVYLQKFLDLAPQDPEADAIRKYILTWKTFGQEIHE